MGFVASEQVKELTYDFNPHAQVTGTIPEPSSSSIAAYRKAVFSAVSSSGLSELADKSVESLDLAKLDGLLEKSEEVEKAMVNATADLTGIANSVLHGLPYRVKRAFLGWVAGEFLNPEA